MDQTCDTCHNYARYELRNTSKINCDECGQVMYNRGSIVMYVCDKNCTDLLWVIESWVERNDDIRAKILMENEECQTCGTNHSIVEYFKGKPIYWSLNFLRDAALIIICLFGDAALLPESTRNEKIKKVRLVSHDLQTWLKILKKILRSRVVCSMKTSYLKPKYATKNY